MLLLEIKIDRASGTKNIKHAAKTTIRRIEENNKK